MDISKLSNPGKRVQTDGLGPVVVRTLSIGAVGRILKLHTNIEKVADHVLAATVIADVCKLVDSVAEANETKLLPESVQKLTEADKWSLCEAIFGVTKEGSDEAVHNDPDQAIAREFRKSIKSMEEGGKKLAESIENQLGSLSGAFREQLDPLRSGGVFSSETKRMLEELTAQSAVLKSLLQQPDWLAQVEKQRKTLDAAFEPLSTSLTDAGPLAGNSGNLSSMRFDVPRIPAIDISNSPIARTANAVEKHTLKLEALADAQRVALDINNQMHGLVARVANELSQRAESNERHTKRNFWVAIAAIAISFVASVGQIVQAYFINVENNVQQSRAEEIGRDQRDSLRAILKQSQEDSVPLRQQSIRQTQAPAVATPAALAPGIASTPSTSPAATTAAARPAAKAANSQTNKTMPKN